MSATPNAMPRKSNTIAGQIVSALIEERPVSWTHKAVDPASADPKRPDLILTKIEGTELRFPLARNVSALNVDRAARKLAA